MLNSATIMTNIPVTDLDRATRFYEEKLGLCVCDRGEGYATLENDNGEQILLYLRAPSTADHTLLSFLVDDFDATMANLRNAGITFEEYDIPEYDLKTVNGIAEMDGEGRLSWFKDSEGNILGLTEKVTMGMQETEPMIQGMDIPVA